MKNFVSKKLIQKYVRRKKLKGAGQLLQYIQDEKNKLNFFEFLSKEGVFVEETKSPFVFHGSTTKVSLLKPQQSMGVDGELERDSYVYATLDPNYAIFLAILDLKDGGAGVVSTVSGTQLTVDRDFVNGKSRFIDGYVHLLAKKGFKKSSNNEYRAEEERKVVLIVEVSPQDLSVPVQVQFVS